MINHPKYIVETCIYDDSQDLVGSNIELGSPHYRGLKSKNHY